MVSVKNIAPAIVSIVLAARSLAAAESPVITGTGYLIGVPVPGILSTNAAGEVSLKGNVHVMRVEADDPRLTGRAQATMDMAYEADGSGLFSGMTYQEVGTWDLTDPLNPKFTPTGGLWQMSYRGLAAVDGSSQVRMTGYGIGGTIDGLRVEETLTRGPGAPFDPAIPYAGTATIKPAPVDTSEVIDNFDDNNLTGWTPESSNGREQLTETNGQLTVSGYWPGVRSTSHYDSWAKGWVSKNWTIADGQTLEWRVDLVRMNSHTSIVEPGAGSWARMQAYYIGFGRGFLALGKLASGPVVFSCDEVAIKETNVVLSLALTRLQTNLVITGRVLDKDDQDAVFFMRSVVDTPEREPSLTTAEFEALTGMHLQWGTDLRGPPLFSGDSFNLEMFQYSDGTKPAAEATFDNLELRTYEVPVISIQQAVQISWPGLDHGLYSLEGAPTVQGPWLPVQQLNMPGIQTLTVPVNSPAGFFRFRLVAAP